MSSTRDAAPALFRAPALVPRIVAGSLFTAAVVMVAAIPAWPFHSSLEPSLGTSLTMLIW